MQLSKIRPIIKPVLIITGAAFLFMTAGCGRQGNGTSVSTSPATPPAMPTNAATASAAAANHGAKDTNKQPDKQPLYKPKEDEMPPLDVKGQTITFNWVEDNRVRMRATASESQVHELNRTGSLKGLSGTMYENGKPTTTMTAPLVVYDMEKRILTATGGVVVRSLDRKTVVRSQWMRWFPREQRVVGSGGVKAKSDMWNMDGPGFVADTALKSVVVRKLVKGSDF